MGDLRDVETTLESPGAVSAPKIKEVPEGNFMMRFADGGDPVTLYRQGKKEYVLNQRTGMRNFQGEEKAETPRFAKPLPIGSVLSMGENQTFLVSRAANRTIEQQYPGSVFVKRIPLENKVDESGNLIEGFNTLRRRLVAEGKEEMVYIA